MTGQDRKPGRLRAGAARVDITPGELPGLNAFGPDFLAVHDRLHARALVLGVDQDVAAVVALDLVEVGTPPRCGRGSSASSASPPTG